MNNEINKIQKNTKSQERPSDIRKRAKHFEESRDEWKERNAQKRTQLQTLMTRNSRLEKKLHANQENSLLLEKALNQTQAWLKALEEENKKKDEEIESLKKKLRR